MADTASPDRVRVLNGAPVCPDADYVLYWMTAQRRPFDNFALDHAVSRARAWDKPLVVLEALRAEYPWASERFHQFVMDGMVDNARAFDSSGVTYVPYVERRPGDGKGLLEALASRACTVVADDYPAFFLPRMVRAAAERLDVRCEAVDGCGLLPVGVADKAFSAAYHFRRFLQRTLAPFLLEAPSTEVPTFPARKVDLQSVFERWPPLDWRSEPSAAGFGASAEVGTTTTRGGWVSARRRLTEFVAEGLPRYRDERNDPDADVPSRLSSYLHFGHISSHEVFRAVAEAEGWSPARIGDRRDGGRQGWWGMSESAESFMDQLVTWRELGFNTAARVEGFERYDSLPEWAKGTLADHAGDPRPFAYDLVEFEEARTHDPLWNAAQRQLTRDGIVHNYLRMLWGKKILE
jgi:deoxyribodipyrimidine photo-lyase